MKNGGTPDGMGQTLRLGPQNFSDSSLGFRPSNDHRIIGVPKFDPKPYGNTSYNLWIVTIDDQIIGICTVYTVTNAGNTWIFQRELQGHDNANRMEWDRTNQPIITNLT